ncbi:T9SS type A sorting domain-containing protein [Marinoscillum sp.]
MRDRTYVSFGILLAGLFWLSAIPVLGQGSVSGKTDVCRGATETYIFSKGTCSVVKFGTAWTVTGGTIVTSGCESNSCSGVNKNSIQVQWSNSASSGEVKLVLQNWDDGESNECEQTIIKDITISATPGCGSGGGGGGGGEFGGLYIAADPTSGILCSDDTVYLLGGAEVPSTRLTWQVKADAGDWTNFYPGTGLIFADSWKFNINETYISGLDEYEFEYGVNYRFRVSSDTEDSSPVGPYVFYPVSPPIESIDIVSPQCKGGEGSVVITHSSIENVRYVYSITKLLVKEGDNCDSGVELSYGTKVYCAEGAVYNAINQGQLVFDLNNAEYLNGATLALLSGEYRLQIESEVGKGTEDAGSNEYSSCIIDTIFSFEDPVYTTLTESAITLNPTAPSCKGNNDGTVGVTVADGTGKGAIKWKNLADETWVNSILTGYSTGDNYKILVGDQCDTVKNKTVDVVAGTEYSPVVAISHPTCNADGAIEVSLPESYNNSKGYSVTYALNDEAFGTSNTFSNLPSGSTYSVKMKINELCSSEQTGVELHPVPQISSEISTDEPSCRDGNDGEISVVVNKDKVNGTTSPISYQIILKDGSTVVHNEPYASSHTLTGLSPKDYTLVIEDLCRGGETVYNASVTVPNVPEVLITGLMSYPIEDKAIKCYDGFWEGDMSFEVSGGNGDYNIEVVRDDDGSGFKSSYNTSFSNNVYRMDDSFPRGRYSIIATDGCGFYATKTFNVNVPEGVSSVISYTPTFEKKGVLDYTFKCKGDKGKVTLEVTGGNSSSYSVKLIKGMSSWDPNPESPPGIYEFENLGAGTYYPKITDASGCSKEFSSNTFELTEPASQLTIYEIAKTDFQTGHVAEFGGGMYSKCHNSNYTFKPAATTIQGGVTPYSKMLGSTAFTTSISQGWSNDSPVTHTFKVTDANGCIRSKEFIINNPPALEFAALHDNVEYLHEASVQCYGDVNQGQIKATASGGIKSYTYHIDGEDQDATINGSHTFQGLTTSLSGVSYTLEITDSLGCSINSSITLTRPALVRITEIDTTGVLKSGNVHIACYGTREDIHFEMDGGYTGGTYNLYIENTLTSWDTLVTVGKDLKMADVPLLAGSYIARVRDEEGCFSGDVSFTLREPSAPLLLSNPVVTFPQCIADSDGTNDEGTIALSATGGTGPAKGYHYTYTILRSGSVYAIKTGTTATFSLPANGYNSVTYTVRVEDVNGCENERTVEMKPDQSPLRVDVTYQAPNCHEGTNGELNMTISNATVKANGKYLYRISGGDLDSPRDILHNQTTLTLDTLHDSKGLPRYEVFVEDRYECDAVNENQVTTINMDAPDHLSVDSIATLRPSFQYMSDGLFTVRASGGVGAFVFALEDIDGAFAPSVLDDSTYFMVTDTLAGPYTVYMRDQNYVTDQKEFCQREVSLIVPDGRVITLENSTIEQITCEGADDGQIQPVFDLSDADPGEETDYDRLTVTWEDLSGAASGSLSTSVDAIDPLTDLPPSTYQIKARYAHYASYTLESEYVQDTFRFTQTQGLQVMEPPALQLTILDTVPSSCGVSDDGRILFSTSGGWPAQSKYYNLDNAGWQLIPSGEMYLSGLAVGSHEIAIGLQDGSCSTAYPFEIGQRGVNVDVTSITHPACYGADNGQIVLSTQTPDVEYLFADSSYTSDFGVYEGLQAGTYRLVVRQKALNSCQSDTLEIILTAPELLSVSTLTENADCGQSNGQASSTVTGGTAPYNTRWENFSGSQVDTSALAAGSYIVIVQDAQLCEARDTFSIEDNPGIQIVGVSVSPADCTYPNGVASFVITNGVSPYLVGEENFSDAEISLSNMLAGDTTLTVVDSRGCSTDLFLSIPAQNTLLVSLDSSYFTTCEEANGAIKVSASGGAAPYTFEWLGLEVSGDSISGLSPGSYSVQVTDGHGCSKIGVYEVISSDGVEGVEWTIDNPYCDLSIGVITVDTVMGDFPPFGLVLTGPGGATFTDTYTPGGKVIFSDLGAGIYQLSVDDQNGCQYTVNGLQLENDPSLLPAFDWEVITQSACDLPTGVLQIEPLSGAAPFTYQWFDEEGNDLGMTGAKGTALTAGYYEVIATDTAGCDQVIAVSMEDRESPILSVTGKTTSPVGAANGTLQVQLANGVGAASGYYLDTTFSESGYFEHLPPGQYAVVGMDSLGCASDTITTQIIGTPQLDITFLFTQDATCEVPDGKVGVQAAGGITPYVFSLEGSVVSSTITGLAPGSYWVAVTDAIGSVDSVLTEVEALEDLAVTNATTLVSCEGACDGTARLFPSGGSGRYAISWSDGASGISRTGLCPGTYGYVVIDDRHGGCYVEDTLIIGEEPYLRLALVKQVAPDCYNGTNGQLVVSASGGSGAYAYSWSTGQTTASIKGSAGVYWVTVTDQTLGCTISDTFQILSTPEITVVDTLITQPSCWGSSTGAVTLVIEHARSPLVRWSNGQIGKTAVNLAAGTYGYDIESSLGCTITGEVTVTERERLAVTTEKIDNLCADDCAGEISLTISGGKKPYSIQWTHGSSVKNPKSLCSGSYSYRVQDAFGCVVEGTVEIQEPPALAFQSATIGHVSCYQGKDGSITPVITGGTTPYTYAWSTGATTPELSGIKRGTYTLVVSDANGCATSKSYSVIEPGGLTLLSTVKSGPSCAGYSDGWIEIEPFGGVGPYSVSWDNGMTGPQISGLAAGAYQMVLTDSKGCSMERRVVIQDPIGMQFSNVTFDNPICHDDANGFISFRVVGGTGVYTYQWSNAAQTSTLEGLSWGDYSVTVKDEEACEIKRTFSLENPEIPQVTGIDDSYIICGGGELFLEPLEPWKTYKWSGPYDFTSSESQVILSEGGEYDLAVTDENDCPSGIATFIEVSENLLEADFIRISEAVTFEPVVFVDLSTPMPDVVNWVLPEDESIVINEKTDISMELVFTEPGEYKIGVQVNLSDCASEIYKIVSVSEADAGSRTSSSNDRKSSPVAVQIFPNPTSDLIRLVFHAPSDNPVQVQLMSLDQTVIRSEQLSGRRDYFIEWDFYDAPAGVYLLVFSHGNQVQSKRIMVLK